MNSATPWPIGTTEQFGRDRRIHSGLILADLIIGHHFSISARCKAASASGDEVKPEFGLWNTVPFNSLYDRSLAIRCGHRAEAFFWGLSGEVDGVSFGHGPVTLASREPV